MVDEEVDLLGTPFIRWLLGFRGSGGFILIPTHLLHKHRQVFGILFTLAYML